MVVISKVLDNLTRFTLWIASFVLVIMMLAIVVGVVFQFLGHPIVGAVEVVQILLIGLIMFTFASTEAGDKHIKIGIIVDHLPKWIQNTIDLFGNVATAVLCFIIGYIFMGSALHDFQVTKEETLMLEFPIYILKFVVSLGFLVWGLEALNRMIKYFSGIEKEAIMIEPGREESSNVS
ncbi:TRAP transporter small permease [Neobacillus drentensis]|uniref:TRAP transporter small permease n=1 Tax=Neobacillus drentensis TaxID=220684 RepID=UPI00082563F4|nr:TRAP transporter small permease [Neobacillus drentensis]